MTKRRRMRLAEEQAAADAAEREAAAEERKKRRGDLLAELDKASGDYLSEGVNGWADSTAGMNPSSDATEDAARLGLDDTDAEIKAITGSILRSHKHLYSDEQGQPKGVFLTSEPRKQTIKEVAESLGIDTSKVEDQSHIIDTMTGKRMYDEDLSVAAELCRTCKTNPARPLHQCPYHEELGKGEFECNCCLDCQTECARDI